MGRRHPCGERSRYAIDLYKAEKARNAHLFGKAAFDCQCIACDRVADSGLYEHCGVHRFVCIQALFPPPDAPLSKR